MPGGMKKANGCDKAWVPVTELRQTEGFLSSSKHLKKLGTKNEKTFFIKETITNVCESENNKGARLWASGFFSNWRQLKKKHPELKDLNPYDLRHYPVSLSIIRGMAMGMDLDEIAFNNGPLRVSFCGMKPFFLLKTFFYHSPTK